MGRLLALRALPFLWSSGVFLPLLRPSGLVGLLLPLPLSPPILLSRSAGSHVLLVRPLLLRLRLWLRVLSVLPLLSAAWLRPFPRPRHGGSREQETERDRTDDSK